MIKCFYHKVDFDGECSAAIVGYEVGQDKKDHEAYTYHKPDTELIGVNHGEDFSRILEQINSEDTVYVVDFCFPIPLMEQIQEKCQELIWIDHHISSINLAKEENFHCNGYRRTDLAACELTWNYLFPYSSMPRIVRLLGRYDVWDHDEEGRIVAFQKGLKTLGIETDPRIKSLFWSDMFADLSLATNKMVELRNIGKNILAKEKVDNAKLCEYYAFETELNGYRAIAINGPHISTDTFDSIGTKYDLMIGFVRKGGKWSVSLRTEKDDVDIPAIAKSHDPNGGGHRKAGGFQCVELPFKF